MKIKVGLVDDHQLFIKSLRLMLETLSDFEVVIESLSGPDVQAKLEGRSVVPDLMLIDVNMPGMDGIELAGWLQRKYPDMKLVALTMNNKDVVIIKMFKAGCCSYLLKDVHPTVLETALLSVYHKGYYNYDTDKFHPGKLFNMFAKGKQLNITPKEQEFLNLACSELTYKQIASKMGMSERTVDGYRESLFNKFGVQSRVGLCLEAIRRGYVSIDKE